MVESPLLQFGNLPKTLSNFISTTIYGDPWTYVVCSTRMNGNTKSDYTHVSQKSFCHIFNETKLNPTQRANEWYLHILGKTRRIYSPECNLTKMSRTSTSSDWSWSRNWTQMTVLCTALFSSFCNNTYSSFLGEGRYSFPFVSTRFLFCNALLHIYLSYPIRLLALAAYSYHPFRKRLSIFGLTFIFGTENWDIKKKLEYNVMSKKLILLLLCIYEYPSYGIYGMA